LYKDLHVIAIAPLLSYGVAKLLSLGDSHAAGLLLLGGARRLAVIAVAC
jgi:hypothetical protein